MKPTKTHQALTEIASQRFFLQSIAKELIAQSKSIEKSNKKVHFACLTLKDYGEDLRVYARGILKLERELRREG